MTSIPSPKKPWQSDMSGSSTVPTSNSPQSKPIERASADNNTSNSTVPPLPQLNNIQNTPPLHPPYEQPQLGAFNPAYPPMDYGANSFSGSFGQQPYMGYSAGGAGGYPFNSYGGSMFNPYGQQMGMFGQPPMSFMSQMQMNTQPAFQVIERIVNTFSGFAQMLSSTYFATYSSFNAMVGVADQFAHLRNYLRNIFSFGSFIRSIQRYLYRLLGWKIQVHKDDINLKEYQKFNSLQKVSFKPLVLFFVVTFGLPYLLHRIMKRMYQHNHVTDPRMHNNLGRFGVDPALSSKLENIEFAKALFDFIPQFNNQRELPFKSEELVAILKKTDENGNPSDWWTGRTRDGKIGLFPNNYVQLLDLNAKELTSIPKEEKGKTGGTDE